MVSTMYQMLAIQGMYGLEKRVLLNTEGKIEASEIWIFWENFQIV